MKRIVQRILALSIILCVLVTMIVNTSVSAETLPIEDLKVVYQQNNSSWKIEGKAGNNAHTAVTLKIYQQELTSLTVGDIENKKGLVKLIYTSDGGEFTDIISLGTFFSSGRYVIEVSCYGYDTAYKSFLHVNPDEAVSIIEQINNASDKDAIGELLQENCYQLGIDEAEYTLKACCVNEIIFECKPEEGYNTQSFLSEYNNALCVHDLKHSENSLELIFNNHEGAISFDYEDDIVLHGEDVVKMVRERLKAADYTELSITEVIRQNLLVSRILCAPRYTYIEPVIASELADGVYDLTDYNQVTDKENVFKKVFNNKTQITKYSDVKTVFEAQAKSALNEENQGGSSDEPSGNNKTGNSPSKGNVITNVKTDSANEDVLIEKKEYFSDVNGHWASKYIEFMVENKIANGYPDGSFKPDGLVTRAEFIKFVVNAFTLTSKGMQLGFEDIRKEEWFASYIEIAASNELVMGANGLFRPNDKLTRQDAAVILSRLIGTSEEETSVVKFNDYDDIDSYANDAVNKLNSMGIINGYNNNFFPKKNITRAEVSAMIVRLKEM